MVHNPKRCDRFHFKGKWRICCQSGDTQFRAAIGWSCSWCAGSKHFRHPGFCPQVRIRGVNSISSGTQPLYVVDGVPVFSGDVGFYPANALGDINPNDIESFRSFERRAASAIYGSRAANGVVLITTKRILGKAKFIIMSILVQQRQQNFSIYWGQKIL